MSIADRACLALGLQRKLTVLTAESNMRLLTLPTKVKLIRNATDPETTAPDRVSRR